MHNNPRNYGFRVVQLPRKTRNQRDYHKDSKHLLLLVSPENPLKQRDTDSVLDHCAPLNCGNKKLILDIDEMLCFCNHREVGFMDRLFFLIGITSN